LCTCDKFFVKHLNITTTPFPCYHAIAYLIGTLNIFCTQGVYYRYLPGMKFTW